MKKFCTDGLDAALTPNRSPNSDVANLKATGDIQAKVIAKACTEPHEGRVRWTLTLLEEEMAVILETKLSRSTIGRILQNNDLRPHLSEYWCIPPQEDLNLLQPWKIYLIYISNLTMKHILCGVWMKNHFSF